jgi:hypothetical protein
MAFQIEVALYKAPIRRPRHFIGKDATLQPKILAKPSTSRKGDSGPREIDTCYI